MDEPRYEKNSKWGNTDPPQNNKYDMHMIICEC